MSWPWSCLVCRAPFSLRTAGHTHVNLDGTLIRTDRSKTVGPTAGVDVVVGQASSSRGGRPGAHRTLWTSLVRAGREHDTTCARAHAGLLDALSDWTDWSIGAHLGRVIGETARTSRYPQPQLVTEPHA
jgi:hypothetical protein